MNRPNTLRAATTRAAQLACDCCSGTLVAIKAHEGHAVGTTCPSCIGETCERCGGERWIFNVNDDGPASAWPCTCTQAMQRAQRLTRARIPARYVECDLPAFIERNESVTKAKLEALKLQKADLTTGRGLLLSGPPGTGKTHLLAALAKHYALRMGIETRFVEYRALLEELKAGFATRASTSDRLVQSLVDVPVLVVDELGAGLGGDWAFGVLDHLITARYQRRHVNVWATNYQLTAPARRPGSAAEPWKVKGLRDVIGERLFSRVLEDSTVVRIEAEDYRIERARERYATEGG